MNELIIKENNLNVNNNILRVVEYKGEKVISSYDIARLHNKEVKRVNEQFERNKDRLQENMDYFLISVEEFAIADSGHKISSKSRHKFERLFTERGYLKLVKSFRDDLSWEVQDILVDSYFKLKQVVLSVKDQCFLDIVKAETQEGILLGLNKLNNEVIVPLENKVAEQGEQITVLQPKGQFYDAVVQSETLLDIGEVSKLLNYKGLGRNNLFRYLRENGILNNKNLPYQTYIDRGYFKIVESSWVNPSTKLVEVSIKTVMFQKGIDWLDKMLAEHFDKNND